MLSLMLAHSPEWVIFPFWKKKKKLKLIKLFTFEVYYFTSRNPSQSYGFWCLRGLAPTTLWLGQSLPLMNPSIYSEVTTGVMNWSEAHRENIHTYNFGFSKWNLCASSDSKPPSISSISNIRQRGKIPVAHKHWASEIMGVKKWQTMVVSWCPFTHYK